jgi:hypothetical protein
MWTPVATRGDPPLSPYPLLTKHKHTQTPSSPTTAQPPSQKTHLYQDWKKCPYSLCQRPPWLLKNPVSQLRLL